MKKRSLFLILVLFTILISGCKYNFIVPEEVTPPNPDGEPVKYSTQIQPIFTNKCIFCHNTGGTAPNLEDGKSYNQVVPEHVNLTTPVESNIYKVPTSATTWHTRKYSSSEAALVLTWIEEGAKNN
jgi:mono/diheme cytochrome c family protein